MKRRVFLIILAAVLCMAAAASALELTFSQTCKQKTSRTTQLYVDINGELVASTVLPAGTYLITNGTHKDGLTGITYSMNDRDPLYGYIDGSAIRSATTTVRLPSGKTVTVSEVLVRSRTALNLWLKMNYGEDLGSSSTYTDEDGNEHEIGSEAAQGDPGSVTGDAKWAKAIGSAFSKNGADTRTVYRDDAGNETDVQVRYMGLIRSMVQIGGEETLVETWRLSWDTEASEEKVLAVVKPDISNVRFREKPSGTSMTRVKGGHVVQVVRIGKHYTLVDINETGMPLGYIATDSLDFYPNMKYAYRTAKVSINGKTTGKNNSVTVYAEDKSGAGSIGKYDLGYPLTVYAQNDKWSEVDVGGYHAFILNKYVTFDQEEGAE